MLGGCREPATEASLGLQRKYEFSECVYFLSGDQGGPFGFDALSGSDRGGLYAASSFGQEHSARSGSPVRDDAPSSGTQGKTVACGGRMPS